MRTNYVDSAIRTSPRILLNFDFNWRAYDAVRHGLSQLIGKGNIGEAKSLALQLIHKGSYQVDCSDEGLMQEDIETCLQPVIATAATLPESGDWALEMLRNDSSGCVCREELTALSGSNCND